ncbi:MAG: N-acetylmuramoyl-L-alanine amidase, partial [Saprospiraceae bacterium]
QAPRNADVTLPPAQLQLSKPGETPGSTVFNATALVDIPLTGVEPFLAWSITWEADQWDESARFKVIISDSEQPEVPFAIEPDPHATPSPGKFISHLYFAGKNARKLRLEYTGPQPIGQVSIHFYSPGNTPETGNPKPKTQNPKPVPSPRSSCSCPQPAYLDRDGWCPSGDCPPDPTPSPTNVTHLIIHHSATANTASDWAAVVRSFWDWHVNVNGWNDIGYNWLIDPNGVVYEGRGDDILGAHFCGKNTGTMGVCVIGTFTDALPAQAALDKLTDLLAWKTCDVGTDPLGSAFHASSGLNLHRISGHRDGCATECPGNAFYPTIPGVRAAVQDHIASECSATAAIDESDPGGNAVRIFPNPASGEVTVVVESAWRGPVEATLFDAFGRPVGGLYFFEKNENLISKLIGLPGLTAGVYLLKIRQGGKSGLFRFVKK